MLAIIEIGNGITEFKESTILTKTEENLKDWSSIIENYKEAKGNGGSVEKPSEFELEVIKPTLFYYSIEKLFPD